MRNANRIEGTGSYRLTDVEPARTYLVPIGARRVIRPGALPPMAAVVRELRPPPVGSVHLPNDPTPAFRSGFSIQRGEPLLDTLRRAAVEQFDAALSGLIPEGGDEGIHLARTSLKRVRALLRLAEGVLGRRKRRIESRLLAGIARRISPVREAAVLIHTLGGIAERYSRLLAPGTFDTVQLRVEAGHRLEASGLLNDRREVRAILFDTRARYLEWQPAAGGFEAIAFGLEATYGRGRTLGREAKDGGSAPAFHEWRKRVKDLRYHLELFEPVWPGTVGELRQRLNDLGDDLGEHHDLDILRGELSDHHDLCPDREERSLLEALIIHRMRQLEIKAVGSGEMLFAEGPGGFVRRIGTYWRVWHR